MRPSDVIFQDFEEERRKEMSPFALIVRLLLVVSALLHCVSGVSTATKITNRFIAKILLSSSLLCLPMTSHTMPAFAVDTKANLIYKSGKNPVPIDANDPTIGSKKDISFLRCMSNCKSKCQLPGEGLAKADCVQDCQDQCCDSYEQCSFKIKASTIGNSI